MNNGEAIPRVIVNPDLEMQLRTFEFDHEKYADYLRSRGLSDDEIRNTLIRFDSTDSVAGGYYHEYLGMGVDVGPSFDNTIINRVLRHETSHRIDYLESRWTPPPDSMYVRLGAAALLGTVAIVVPGLDSIESVAIRLIGVGIGSFAAGSLSTKLNGTERRARKAEKNSVDFVRVEPKDKPSPGFELWQNIKFKVLRSIL